MYLEKHNIAPERVIERDENSVVLEMSFSKDCDFFEGHFPEIQLLPAVAQIDIIMNMAHKYFSTPVFAAISKRTKFGAPIFPENLVRMSLKFNREKNAVVFKLGSVDGEKTFSSGTITLGTEI